MPLYLAYIDVQGVHEVLTHRRVSIKCGQIKNG